MVAEGTTIPGKCLCGAVQFTVTAKKPNVGVCHCKMCRTWSGGVVFALSEVEALDISKDDNLGIYKSSEWGERCFCKTCGSNLFWRSPSYDHVAVMAGALDDSVALNFTSEIYTDSKPAYYAFANDTKKMTEAEFVALFADAPPKD